MSVHGWRGGRLLNYIGQLRPYSYADLLLLFCAVQASDRYIVGASALWFGFLIHLEWRHRDNGRALWPWFIWAILWAVGVVLLPTVQAILFIGLGVIYALKKRFPKIGRISFLYNGALKGALIIGVALSWRLVIGVSLIMAFRNLMGDVRDAGKDFSEGVVTLPVALGLRQNVPWVYPLTLAATSVTWTILGRLPVYMLALAFLVECTTYKLTPR